MSKEICISRLSSLFHSVYMIRILLFRLLPLCYGSCEDDQRHEVWNYHQAVKESDGSIRDLLSARARKTNTTTISENGTTAFFPNRYCTFCLAKKYHPTMVENAKNRRNHFKNARSKPLRPVRNAACVTGVPLTPVLIISSRTPEERRKAVAVRQRRYQ